MSSSDYEATRDVPASGAKDATTLGDASEAPGAMIGAYKILQLMGEGGFGSVYLAEQEKPVRRQVALKIIKLGMDTRQVVARFEQERQALAIMDHPNIARVLDAGATEKGRPYFVMEVVRGEPIVAYCDKNTLSLSARLELFAQVCSAVQHAHTKGIIHRDLKPSNILVSTQDGAAVPKVIDFGIAKATASKLTDRTLYTEHRQMIGTPEYMSPEQAEGSLDLDTRTDVYALGVLLYELLTGSTPFSGKELRSAADGEMQRIIREVDPPMPSTRVKESGERLERVAARRRMEPARLGTAIRGELDWIVMKAMEKDRSRRYETANGLAMDVRRYLGGEPVTAAPPSKVYRFKKFVRRNRATFAGATLAGLALMAGMVGTSVGLVRAKRAQALAEEARHAEGEQRALAEARLGQAEATVKFLDDMLAAADPNAQGKDVTVRAVLDRAAATLGTKYAKEPLVAARLHGTIGRTYVGLGEYGLAEPHVRESRTTFQRVLGAGAEETCRAVNEGGAILLKLGRLVDAETELKAALADHTARLGRKHEITTQTMDLLSQVYAAESKVDEAEGLQRELLAILRETHGAERLETINAMSSLAMILMDQEKFEESESLLNSALGAQERMLGVEHPLSLQVKANLALLQYQIAMPNKRSNPEEHAKRIARGRVLGEETMRAQSRVLGEEHPDTMRTLNNLVSVYRELKMYDEADRLSLRDIDVCVRNLGEEHPDTIASLANFGSSLRNRGRCAEALPYLERALKSSRNSLPGDVLGKAFTLGWTGSCLRNVGRHAEGEPLLLEARGIIVRLMGEEHPIAKQMAIDLRTLYESWEKAEPGKGYAARAEEWKKISGEP